jgi:putative membrane protein
MPEDCMRTSADDAGSTGLMPAPGRAPMRVLGPRPVADRSLRALRLSTLALGSLLVVTGIAPADRLTWSLEVLPVVAILGILWVTRTRFPLTPVLHAGIALGLALLCAGAHYTFERVPLGEWLRDAFGLARNPYDRLGHLLQGAVPALAAREVFVRTTALRGSAWLAPLALVASFGASAAYELFEWAVAAGYGSAAVDFLGHQGDPWDAHADMACALAGATAALALLTRLHDRALSSLHDRGLFPLASPGARDLPTLTPARPPAQPRAARRSARARPAGSPPARGT